MAVPRLRRGSQLGKYRLERLIGHGASASVWRARDTVENRPVALKIIDSVQVGEWGRDAIAHEARIATRLAHPNIVAVRNADWVDGHFVLATDLAERSLADYAGARRSGERGPAGGARCRCGPRATPMRTGILHRDVKPENVLIFADRHAALGGLRRVALRARRDGDGHRRRHLRLRGAGAGLRPSASRLRRVLARADRLRAARWHAAHLAVRVATRPGTGASWRASRRRFARCCAGPRPSTRAIATRTRSPSIAALERAFARIEQPRPARRRRQRRKRAGAVAARAPGGELPAPLRRSARAPLPLPPLRRTDRRGDARLPVVRLHSATPSAR